MDIFNIKKTRQLEIELEDLDKEYSDLYYNHKEVLLKIDKLKNLFINNTQPTFTRQELIRLIDNL